MAVENIKDRTGNVIGRVDYRADGSIHVSDRGGQLLGYKHGSIVYDRGMPVPNGNIGMIIAKLYR